MKKKKKALLLWAALFHVLSSVRNKWVAGEEVGKDIYCSLSPDCWCSMINYIILISGPCDYDLPTVRLSPQTLSQIKLSLKPLLLGAFVDIRLSQGYTPPPSPVGPRSCASDALIIQLNSSRHQLSPQSLFAFLISNSAGSGLFPD